MRTQSASVLLGSDIAGQRAWNHFNIVGKIQLCFLPYSFGLQVMSRLRQPPIMLAIT